MRAHILCMFHATFCEASRFLHDFGVCGRVMGVILSLGSVFQNYKSLPVPLCRHSRFMKIS